MSKANVIQKEKKRFLFFNKYYNKIKILKKKLKDEIKNSKNKSFFNNLDTIKKIQKIPKDAHGVRIRNRCHATGRARGVFRRFGLSRCVIREVASKGFIPGIFKSS